MRTAEATKTLSVKKFSIDHLPPAFPDFLTDRSFLPYRYFHCLDRTSLWV